LEVQLVDTETERCGTAFDADTAAFREGLSEGLHVPHRRAFVGGDYNMGIEQTGRRSFVTPSVLVSNRYDVHPPGGFEHTEAQRSIAGVEGINETL
jgi:hypothetical protein